MKKENLALRLLYQTKPGRRFLKVLIKPGFSKWVFHYLDSPFSKWMIGPFIKKHNINMREYEKTNYSSFNDFFIRKKARIVLDRTPNHLICPCDGYLRAYNINSDCAVHIKNTVYTLQSLLQNKALADRYQDGVCLVFRLTPNNYHRYIYIDDGIVQRRTIIPGVLHCVRPIACEKFPVYVQNSREYTVLSSKHLGTVVQMEIGALLIGRIFNTLTAGKIKRGQEKGFFEFGGSTIVILLEKNTVILDENIRKNSSLGKETKVTIGKKAGHIYAEKKT